MKQLAKVLSVDGKNATVHAERSTMCEGCHAKNCGAECSMYKIFGGSKSFEAKAQNTAGAVPGDTVTVETSDAEVNISAFIVFILPIIIGFGAYAAARTFLSETFSIIAAFGVFVLYFAALAIIEKTRKNAVPKLKITSVVRTAQDDNNIKE